MRQKLTIILTILLMVGVLIVINAATYQRKEDQQDSELAPNRSTYHAGATGTRALYDLLSESGYKVMRWREEPQKLLSDNQQKVGTFVIVGATPLTFDEDQAQSLLLWVSRGGRLVIVDRHPDARLLPISGEWRVTMESGPILTVDPGKPEEMTANVQPVHPVQPTLLTQNIDAVLPSRLAASINFVPAKKDGSKTDIWDSDNQEGEAPPPPSSVPVPTQAATPEVAEGATNVTSPAPVVHLADSRGNLLLDYPHGE
ncbi:MAG: DUF4350 domain-containing protein, partial [Acidobacteriota bacterium]